VQRVQVRLVVVEQVDRGRLEPLDLPAQLRPDGAAGAGDQHPPALDHAAGLVGGDVHLGPAEQLVDAHAAQVGQADVAFDRGQERRQVAHQQTAAGGELAEFGDAAGLQRRDRDQRRLGAGGLGHFGQRGQLPEHRQPVDPAQPDVVVEETDGAKTVRRNRLQRPDKLLAGVAGAEHQGRQARVLLRGLTREPPHEAAAQAGADRSAVMRSVNRPATRSTSESVRSG
jgi:hypothetical protein